MASEICLEQAFVCFFSSFSTICTAKVRPPAVAFMAARAPLSTR